MASEETTPTAAGAPAPQPQEGALPQRPKLTFKALLKDFVLFLIVTVLLAALGTIFGLVGIPLWPNVLLLFIYAMFDRMDNKELLWTVVSGIVGTFVAMSSAIFTEITGSSTVGLIAMIIGILILGTAAVVGNVKWAKMLAILMLCYVMLMAIQPWQIAGLSTATDIGALKAFLLACVSFVVSIPLMMLIGWLAKKLHGGKKAEAKAAA